MFTHMSFPKLEMPEFDFRPSWHQLIVVGNGFDLECGLKSGFGSFLDARKEAFKLADDDLDAGEAHFRKTLWDLVLGSLEGSNWCDVEGAIRRWLVGSDVDELENAGALMDEVLESLIRLNSACGIEPLPEIAPVYYFLDRTQGEAAIWSRKKLLERTMADLHALERDFAAYLHEEIGIRREYSGNASRLMANLLRDSRVSEKDFKVESSVLSFNYTTPFASVDSYGLHVPVVNIHGALRDGDAGGENIVFGIDGTGLLGDSDIMPFTKTYRIMSLGTGDGGELVHIPPANGNQDFGTSLIKFYGHSLARADYSYFQAIFDAVRLYEGDVRLIFYYRRHSRGEISPEAEVEELAGIRTATMKQVIALLNAYGDTLDNKDHGRNLIHKLLIEGRLTVMELPDYEADSDVAV